MDQKIYPPSGNLSEGVYYDKNYIRVKDDDGNETISFLNESDASYNTILRKFLYNERIKTNKAMLARYKDIKEEVPMITRTFIDPEKYKGLNLFVDLSYYHHIFMDKSTFKSDKGIKIYFDMINRLIDNDKLKDVGYNKFSVIIPVTNEAWNVKPMTDIWDYRHNINPISAIARMVRINPVLLKQEFSKYQILFINDKGYFTVDFDTFGLKELPIFITNVRKMIDKSTVISVDSEDKIDSAKAITAAIVDKIEISQNITINNISTEDPEDHKPGNGAVVGITREPVQYPTNTINNPPAVVRNLTGPAKETPEEAKIRIAKADLKSDKDIIIVNHDKSKSDLVQTIKAAASNSTTVDDTIDKLDNKYDDYVKDLIISLSDDEDGKVKLSATRSARMTMINDDLMKKKVKGVSVATLLSTAPPAVLPITKLPIDSINKEWQELSFINFNKVYNPNNDIMEILYSFRNKSVQIGILDVKVEDTSTTEDYIETYTVNCEDEFGKRFTLKFDIPRLKNNRFMRLRGNEKVISGQLLLLPIIKTNDDTVQIVSNYNKIFIRRYGAGKGKSFPTTDRIIKAVNKLVKEGSKDIKVTYGDNSKICAKYELPIDYIDLASEYTRIESKMNVIMFNQDEVREKLKDKIDYSRGLPIGYNKKSGAPVYFVGSYAWSTASDTINYLIGEECPAYAEIYNTTKPGIRYTYSKASILGNEIPIIVILGYTVGLIKALDLSGVQYHISESRDKHIEDNNGFVKFKDGYIYYETGYASSLLFNGLKECDTANYSLSEINSKSMWLDFLDNFGGRILSDGLDNFNDLMVDPITEKICVRYKMPTDYPTLLIHANNLLADNKYNRHVDITGNRYRSNEIIPGYLYRVLAKSYGEYKNQLRRSRKGAAMTIKRGAVIDAILQDPTAADLSILNPLLEAESANTVSFKGLSGMNSDRSYGLDKRTYDDSMINILALSTGFASNVGINRQATIDMNIEGDRGYIKPTTDTDKMSITKSFSITEALTPFGTTRDDPFRSAMTFIQTSKHGMRVKKSMPQLITTGADEALPYLTSDTFSFKSKGKGKVVEKVDNEYMIVEYTDKTNDFIDLRDNVKKNSDGGFFITIKLDSDLKVGDSIKDGQILAYDKKSFSDKLGSNKNIAYSIGTLAKVAILTTDEGYEDSTIVSEWLSDAMSSEVVTQKTVTLPKGTNVYSMVSKGQLVQEGDPLIVFQNAFDDADVNILMKNLTDDEDFVSDIGRIPIKSHVTGVVQDINIYRTVEKEELSPTLRKYVDKYDKPLNAIKSTMKKYNIDDIHAIEPTYALDTSGKLKNAADSVLIEFYIKYDDKLGIGDKIVATNAAKGVVKEIFPIGSEPTSSFRPDEPIHALFSVSSFNARMITSVLMDAVIDKVLIEMDRTVKGIMGVPFQYIDNLE